MQYIIGSLEELNLSCEDDDTRKYVMNAVGMNTVDEDEGVYEKIMSNQEGFEKEFMHPDDGLPPTGLQLLVELATRGVSDEVSFSVISVMLLRSQPDVRAPSPFASHSRCKRLQAWPS